MRRQRLEVHIESPDQTSREACLLRKAIRSLLREHPDGLSRAEICGLLLSQSRYAGTRRNLEFQAAAILQTLIDEKKIEIRDRKFVRRRL